ncbi:MAG TPA: condensation domain-containing protein, partial [Thermoanaerobaculia bacterium]|nr:condensation domain-containing protein [Thermoanaerobaculia bacterium]
MSGLAERLQELSPRKRELLLRQLRSQRGGEQPGLSAIPKQPRDGRLFPLSYAQQRLWFLDQLEPGNPFYNLPGAVRLAGPLDERALRRALAEVVRRHEALRTVFVSDQGRPAQRIGEPPALIMPVVDLGTLGPRREKVAMALAAALVRRPFDLARGPLLRALLLRLGPEERVLAFVVHHIVADGWSLRILVREVSALYAACAAGAASPLPELPVQYADYAAAERQWLAEGILAPQLDHWKRRLAGLPAALELPADRPRPEMQTFRGGQQPLAVPPAVLDRLRALGQGAGTTLFMGLLAAFMTLLHRYTQCRDLAVGMPIANRDRAETEGLIGFFVNTLVLRGDLSGDPPVRTLLARVRAAVLEAFAHRDLPFERLVEELRPERDLAHSPLFQVLFAFQSIPAAAPVAESLAARPLPVEIGRSLFDLTLSLEEEPGVLAGWFEYNRDLFDAARLRRLAGHYLNLLAAMAAAPERRLSELPLLSAAERQQLLAEWAEPAGAGPARRRAHELFEARAAERPAAPALVWGALSWSYGELNARANR